MTSITLREMLVKQEPRYVNYCYVCSGLRAEYTIFAKPYGDHPFFPFLEHHQPPDGSESMGPDGRVLVCLICYTFLNQQWDSYEKNKTPQNKRIYWLKRLDNGPFAGMDLNLQQDYEALFESSNAAGEHEARQKVKHSRSIQSNNLEASKPVIKFQEKQESSDSSSFQLQNEKVETQANNILDLSMPSRSLSQSSLSASPSSSSEVCYVCGQDSKSVINIFVKPIANCPFFPSLKAHVKPDNAKAMDANGKVYACEKCHKSLIQQWDYYQKQNVPHNERVYQLNCQPKIPAKNDIPNKDRSFVCYICGMVTQLSIQRFIHAYPKTEGDPYFSFLLHLNPHPGASRLVDGKAAVCSVCCKSLSRQRRVYELSSVPEECRKYKILNESTSDNYSVLRQHLKSGAENQTTDVKSECYLCDTITESLFHVHTIPSSDMYFPFIRNLKHPNANLIDSQGRVRVCSQCHNSLRYQWEAFEHAHIPINQRQYKVSSSKLDQSEKYVVPSSQQCDSSAVLVVKEEEYSTRKSIRDVCSLCERQLSSENVCVLDTQPQKEGMYFPSIELLVKSNRGKGIDHYGRVLACNQCYVILKKQWDVFESAHVPHSQRQYEIYPPSHAKEQVSHFASNIQLAEASNALHIQVSSPDLKFDVPKHSGNSEPLLTTVNTVPVSNVTMSNAHIVNSRNSPLTVDLKTPPSKSNSEEPPAPKISGPLDVPYVRPLLLMPTTCFICGEYNSSGLTYAIKCVPKLSEDVPFFPFLTKHPIPEGAEKLTNDGSALSCMFCYHSMISQWLAYESSPFPEDGNQWTRHYNTHNYVCFICGITTYRKRVCSISVRDFPFLVEHTRPPGALTLLNGECVVTCLMCFESVTSQWKDFERMKVPVEMRKYNWIVMPPPPDDENSRGCQILSGQESSAASNIPNETDQATLDESGLSHGLKPSTSHMPVPVPYGLVKPVNRSLVSPAHQAGGSQAHAGMGFSPFANNANAPALSATRTSSFAAALRKLAKQAIDPIPDKELSPVSPASSPASSQQSGHSRHHSSLPMYLSRHSNASPMSHSSSPIVTTAPVHNSSMQGKGMDLGRYSSNGRNSANNPMEPVSLKVENSKSANSCNEKRIDPGQGAKQFAPSNLQMGLRQQEHAASLRGFQPYRNLEDHHGGPPQMYNSSSPPPNAERYSYHHPAFAQSSHVPPHSYRRLEDSVYLERYGLLRPTVMPYPPSSNVLPNRASLYSSSHYPPELLSQSGRPLSSNNESYTPRFTSEEESIGDNTLRKREMDLYRERERYLESEEGRREREMEYLRQERNNMSQSPISRSYASGRADVAGEDKERIGSIIHGTPRDLVLRRHSPPSAAIPLNLATTVNHAEEHIKKEEFEHPSNRHHYNAPNGLPIHAGFRKDDNVSSYQIVRQVNQENDQKRSHDPEASDSSAPLPPKFASYYSERDFQKAPVVETRTLTMSSVINSQINGIFSREKYTNPNPYEFPGSIGMGAEKSLMSDGHSRSKPEPKNLYIAQENYPGEFSRSTDKDDTTKGMLEFKDGLPPHGSYSHSMGHRDRIQLQENESKSKMMSFNAADHSYDDVMNHPSYKGRPPSLTKALLQSNVAPSVLEHYMNIGKECPPKVVSVLDEREVKARKSRLKGISEESEDSEADSDEETALRIKRCLTIHKDPTLKMDLDPKKIKFLSKVGLLTHSKKQTFELKKCIQRHKILREKSCSPFNEEPIKDTIQYDLEHLSELSKRLCIEENYSSKKDFLCILHLESLTEDQKIEREKVSKVIISEKARRNGELKPSQRCLELQGFPSRKRGYSILHGLKHNSAKKSNLNDFDDNMDSEAIRGHKNVPRKNMSFTKIMKSDATPERRLSAFLKPKMRTVNLPVPPLIPTPQAMSISENPTDKNSTGVPLPNPRAKQLNKDFVQEFHNSVLQTTQMKLAVEKISPIKKSGEVSSDKIPEENSKESMDCLPDFYSPSFRWPGIEAIMESYECHISEQSNEKIFLAKSCQALKAALHQSNLEIECLGQKTKELMQEKHKLELEREKMQCAIDNFKSFIQRYR